MTSRPPPPVVVPLVHDGVRYAPDASPPIDPAHPRAGYLAAVDVASGRKLWSLRIWSIVEDPAAPPHPGRYFGRVSLGPRPDELLVEDEFGARFVVDRVRVSVRELPDKAERAPRGIGPSLLFPIESEGKRDDSGGLTTAP